MDISLEEARKVTCGHPESSLEDDMQEHVYRPTAVAIVPVRTRTRTDEVEVLLVRQRRPLVDEPGVVEIVTGQVDRDENPRLTAERALATKAGLEAVVWTLLAGDLMPAPGCLSEPVYLFAARALTTKPGRKVDGDWVLLRQAVEMVWSGEIRDMRAMLGVLLVDKLHHGWRVI